MDEVRASAKQVVVVADLSHPNVWSLEIICVGYYKLLITSLMESCPEDAQMLPLFMHPKSPGKHFGETLSARGD